MAKRQRFSKKQSTSSRKKRPQLFLLGIIRPVKQLFAKLRAPKILRPIFGYFKNAWLELKKVTWPSRRESWRLTFVVIIFTVVFAFFLKLVDLGFEKVAERIFL